MKKNKKIIFAIIVLAIIAAMFIFTRSNSTLNKDYKDFAIADTSLITKIYLADKNNNSITLKKNSPGDWIVNEGHKARNSGIETILNTMQKIRVRQPVSKAAHNSVVRRLSSSSIKVEIYQMAYRINLFGLVNWFPHEKLVKTYYVGGATRNNMGTYMLIEGSPEPFVVHIPRFRGFVATRYSVNLEDWRDFSIFKQHPSEIESVSIEFPEEPELSYKIITKNNNTFDVVSLSNNQALQEYDTLKVLNFLSSFKNINFEALLNDKKPEFIDSVTSYTPFHIITLNEKSGGSTKVKTFHKGAYIKDDDENPANDIDRFFALVNDEKDFVLIQFYTFDKITRPINYFKKE